MAGLLAAAMIVAACGGSDDSATSSGSSGSGSSGGKTLVVDAVFSLKSADPAHNYEPTGQIVARALYSTLVTFAGDDLTKVVPDLATSWTTSDDGKTYTFTLNPAAKFTDGTPVTSADVVFSLNRVANVKGNPSFLMDGLTVSAPDAKTVVVESATVDSAVLGKLANPSLGILNSAKAKAAGATDAADAATTDTAEQTLNSESMGSGPYTLQSLDLTTEVDFAINADYWGTTKPTYSKVVLRNVDAAQQKNNVVTGQSQLALDLSPDQVKDISGGEVVSNSVPSQYTFYLFTNANPEINQWTANRDFEDAIRYGIDYDSLLELAGDGSRQAAGMIPIQLAGALPDSDDIKRDVDKAKASLAKSGYDGSAVQVSYPSDLTQNGVSFTDMATRIQANLKEVGINVELQGAPITTVLDLARGGKQQIGLWLWGPDFPDASNYLAFGPGGVVGGKRVNWQPGSDPTIEALMAKALETTDENERIAVYQDYQRELNKGPIMSLIQPAQVFLSASSLKGLTYNLVWTVNLGELS